jgi:hypothetical protein
VVEIDGIIAAVLAGDRSQVAPFFAFTETACTTVTGLGGPPKCSNVPGSPPDGTVVSAFPVGVCEGTWLFELDRMLGELLGAQPQLYGVIRIEPPQRRWLEEPSSPVVDHFILLEVQSQQSGRIGEVLGVRNGKVVIRDRVCIGPPEAFLDHAPPYRFILRGPAYQ